MFDNDDKGGGEGKVNCANAEESSAMRNEKKELKRSSENLSILLIYFRKDNNHKQFPSSLFSYSSSSFSDHSNIGAQYSSTGC